MTKLISSTGLSARIHHLPGREPFMLAADLAEAYGTETKRIGEQVKRNPDRFPERYAFRLNEDEMTLLRSQNATASKDRALPLAFNRAGAYALSAVLKTDIAAEVSVVIYDTFAAMEERAFEQLHATMSKLRCDVLVKKPIYHRIVMAAAEGWSFEQLWRQLSYSRPKLEQAVRECVGLGLIAAPLAGMQPDLFAGV